VSFQTELDGKNQHRINLVVKFGSVSPTYFSSYQPDSGLTVDADKIGLIQGITVNPSSIDLRTAKQVIGSTTIEIKDHGSDQTFAKFMGTKESGLQSEQVTVYVGLKTGSFAFADYVNVGTFVITTIQKDGVNYKLMCKSLTTEMKKPTFQAKGHLEFLLNTSVTTFTVVTPDDVFPASGLIAIEDEIIAYDVGEKSFAAGITTFAGITRASHDSTEVEHKAGVEVRELFEVEENPIDILLKLILSTSGTSAYDVYHDGLGISDTQVDVTGFEDIRDNFFVAEQFRLYLGLDDTLDTLAYIEKHLLIPNNLRFTDKDGKIGLAILDQSVPGATLPILDDSNTATGVKWKSSSDKIVNYVRVKWDWSPGKKAYQNTTLFEDTESQSVYGVKTVPDLEFRGIQSDLSGNSILTDRMDRYLARFATPQVEIDTKNFLKTYNNPPGEKVNLVSDEVPNPGGGLGIDAELEVLQRSINMQTGEVSFKLVFTSYIAIRRGLIAPAPLIVSVVDQKTFEVPDVLCYAPGYKLRLWDDSANDYFPDAVNEVDSIDPTTNRITMVNNWSTTLTTSVRIKFADYDDAHEKQKARYAFVAPNSGIFPDGNKAYQIIF
jgi:hypothetical protein